MGEETDTVDLEVRRPRHTRDDPPSVKEAEMDSIAQRLSTYSWPYASQDPAALDEIATNAHCLGLVSAAVGR